LNVDLTTVARAFDEVRRRDLVDVWIGVAPLEIWGKGKEAILRRLRTIPRGPLIESRLAA
jgi:hypothetical protein